MSEKPSKFLVVHATSHDNPSLGYKVDGFGADLRQAKKDAATDSQRYAKPGDKVLVYELRWASTARSGNIVLDADPEEPEPVASPEPKSEPKSEPAPAVSA